MLLWRRATLALLILINVGTAAFVAIDLHRRLGADPLPTGAAEVAPAPTLIPAPTPLPTGAPTDRPTEIAPSPAPTAATAIPELPAFPSVLVADDRFSYAPDFYAAEVQAFLEEQGSGLAQVTVPLGQGQDPFAHALTAHCIRYGLNPKVLLALLEVQSGAVRREELTEKDLEWAFGYLDPGWQGLDRQLQWATFILADSFRGEEPGEVPVLTDGTLASIPGQANAATQALLRLLAYTADAERFAQLRSDGVGSFVATYRDLFDEDPRLSLGLPLDPPREPFLRPPLSMAAPISSYFDHEYPIFRENGSLLTYTGERGHQSYDGHDGWDYALGAGSPVLAAAAGRVAFAGFVDTLCPTPAGLVVLDHGQGFRTLYWHLQRIDAEEGSDVAQGERIGTVGSTGCSSGPHLHFGVEYMGRDTDPYGWCGSAEIPMDPWAEHPAGVVSHWLWMDLPSPCPVPARAVAVDDQGQGYTPSPALWYEAPVGYEGHAYWTVTTGDHAAATHRAVWRPNLPEAGRYFLYAYIPWYDTNRPDTTQARYHVRYAGGDATVTVDQAHGAGLWVPLGAFSFNEGSRGYVYLDEVTADPGQTVWFDAIVWVRE